MTGHLFENALFVTAGRAYNFLRYYITEGTSLNETGHVEATTGFVEKHNITRDEIAAYVTSEGDPWVSEARNFPAGLYLTQVDNSGFVYGYYYGDQHSASAQSNIDADFEKIDRAYEVWAGGQGL